MIGSSLDFRNRAAAFAAVDGARFDLIVIGAGITGAGVARDAAMRGLSVALIEAHDIASGTSSRSSKMIHGGLRYLAQGDVAVVREAASERQILRVIAPHLTRYSPFCMPGSRTGIATMRAGLATFERLGKVPKHERHTVLDGDELLEFEPTLRPDRYSAGVVYPEFLTNDSRLTLANVRSAAANGAVVLTRAPVIKILMENGRGAGVECRGNLPGEDLGAVIHGRAIVNAAGPWVDAIRALESESAPAQLTLTKGIHAVVPHERLPVRDTVITMTKDRRPVFAVRVGEVTYLGTTDTFYPSTDVWPRVEWADVDYLLDTMNATFGGEPLRSTDVVSIWAGIRPLISQAGKKPSEISRKDETWIGPGGVLSIAGGKLTAYRTMAERIVDRVATELGRSALPCRTGTEPLVGGDADPAALRSLLVATMGKASERLVDLWGSEALGLAADGGDLEAEIRHAVTQEGTLRLEDYWIRRSGRAWFTLDPVGHDLDIAGDVMAELLGWSADRRASEISNCRTIHQDSIACLDHSHERSVRGLDND